MTSVILTSEEYGLEISLGLLRSAIMQQNYLQLSGKFKISKIYINNK